MLKRGRERGKRSKSTKKKENDLWTHDLNENAQCEKTETTKKHLKTCIIENLQVMMK